MENSRPYDSQPATSRWKESVGKLTAASVDPTMPGEFNIDRNTLIASAGSCFAQHIRNHLIRRGYTYLITEPGSEIPDPDEREDRGYGIFPARFGNVYTTPQLNQLLDRSFGRFKPAEDHWFQGGRYYDPYRPNIEPEGFDTLDALNNDRQIHLAATRRMFEEVEVFIFTLGLTECWRSKSDGAVLPLCPGYPNGVFDPALHEFINLGVTDTQDALFAFIERLRDVNPSAKIILTVSPVPLAASMSKTHVLQATVYSKSVLRVVAEEARRCYAHVSYFPSYEIITATGRADEFFAGDRRTVTALGVGRVMDLFFKCYAGESIAPAKPSTGSESEHCDTVICDEETILRVLEARRGEL